MSLVDRRAFALSPQQVDPLSWFTGPLVPLVFGALSLVYGSLATIATWGSVPAPGLQLFGVLLGVAGCLVVYLRTRPLRPPIGWPTAAVTIGLGVAGGVLHAVGAAGGGLAIELWWVPFSPALVIGALAPYLPARPLAIAGMAATVVLTTLASLVVWDADSDWGPVSTAVIITMPTVLGTVVAVAFSATIAARTLPLIEARARTMLTPDAPHDAAARRREFDRTVRLTAQAMPLLEQVARTGEVTAADRTLAGQLARRLRDDLVTRSNLTWLDSIAQESGIVVVDPDRRAAGMRMPQRTALRALLRALLDLPGARDAAVLVEFRAHDDGGTLVGVSAELELPEGPRALHLAPSYLALDGAVEELRWHDDGLGLSFRIDPPGRDADR